MPITASVGGSARQDPIPAGSHHAICFGVVAIGTQPSKIEEYVPKKKVVLIWELPEERGDFGEKSNVPRTISKRYTLSMNPKANLRKDLESWRGRPFTDVEAAKFDIGALIGANCMVNVVHTERNGSQYANVTALMPIPKGMSKRTNENPNLYFNLEEAIDAAMVAGAKDVDFPANLPPWLVEASQESDEYKAFIGAASAPKPAAAAKPAPKQQDLEGEGVPF